MNALQELLLVAELTYDWQDKCQPCQRLLDDEHKFALAY